MPAVRCPPIADAGPPIADADVGPKNDVTGRWPSSRVPCARVGIVEVVEVIERATSVGDAVDAPAC